MDAPPREEGEEVSAYYERSHTLHRTITVCEFDHDIDRDIANRNVDAVELLARHIVQIGDITDPRVIKTQVAPSLMKADYDYGLLRCRAMSLGPIFSIKETCPKCREENDFEIDLSDFKVNDMADPYARLLEWTTASGDLTVWRHLAARDIEAISDIVEDKDDEIRQVTALRLISINGETPKKGLLKRGRLGRDGDKEVTPELHVQEASRMLDILAIPHGEKEAIRKALAKMVGSVDTLMRHRCKFCRAGWGSRVSIGMSFFMASSEV